MLVAWAGMALAVLSKGLIGIVFPGRRDLPALPRAPRLAAAREARVAAAASRSSSPSPRRGSCWCRCANPEFPQFFFVHEHFERFLTTAHRREEPWWFFWPILFVGFLPWMLTLVPGRGRRLAARGGAAPRFPWRRFALALERLRDALLQRLGLEAARLHPARSSPSSPSCWATGSRARRRTRLWKPVGVLAPVARRRDRGVAGARRSARRARGRGSSTPPRGPGSSRASPSSPSRLAAAALRLRAGRQVGRARRRRGGHARSSSTSSRTATSASRRASPGAGRRGDAAPHLAPADARCTRSATTTRRSRSTSGARSRSSTTGTSSRRASTHEPQPRDPDPRGLRRGLGAAGGRDGYNPSRPPREALRTGASR